MSAIQNNVPVQGFQIDHHAEAGQDSAFHSIKRTPAKSLAYLTTALGAAWVVRDAINFGIGTYNTVALRGQASMAGNLAPRLQSAQMNAAAYTQQAQKAQTLFNQHDDFLTDYLAQIGAKAGGTVVMITLPGSSASAADPASTKTTSLVSAFGEDFVATQLTQPLQKLVRGLGNQSSYDGSLQSTLSNGWAAIAKDACTAAQEPQTTQTTGEGGDNIQGQEAAGLHRRQAGDITDGTGTSGTTGTSALDCAVGITAALSDADKSQIGMMAVERALNQQQVNGPANSARDAGSLAATLQTVLQRLPLVGSATAVSPGLQTGQTNGLANKGPNVGGEIFSTLMSAVGTVSALSIVAYAGSMARKIQTGGQQPIAMNMFIHQQPGDMPGAFPVDEFHVDGGPAPAYNPNIFNRNNEAAGQPNQIHPAEQQV